MNEGSTSDVSACPDCGASVAREAGQCWLCRRQLGDFQERDAAAKQVVMHQQPRAGLSFRLNSLMLTVTLIAVCLGVLRLAPGIGIAFSILVTPAFVRAVFAARMQRVAGQPMNTLEKTLAFIASLGIVVTIATAACCTFYLTCWIPVLPGLAINNLDAVGIGLVVGICLGGIAGIAVAVVLILKLWPLRKKKEKTVIIIVALVVLGLIATLAILSIL
jgi:hypothetical protein